MKKFYRHLIPMNVEEYIITGIVIAVMLFMIAGCIMLIWTINDPCYMNSQWYGVK